MRKNRRPAGEITDTEIREVIATSGYPLQVRVAAQLATKFDITEEWSYTDRTSGELRTLDLVAEHRFPAPRLNAGSAGVRMLVECKQSQWPYVFFKGVGEQALTDFPAIHGVNGQQVFLGTRDSYAGRYFPVPVVLGLSAEPFVSSGPPLCPTFSKVVEKQDSSFELSGEDPYKRIILPLLSAIEYASVQRRPSDALRCDPTLTLAVCVLNARMIVHDAMSNATTDEKWVRIIRRESKSKTGEATRGVGAYVFDIVHVDFLDSFISECVWPLADTFAGRVRECYDVLCRLSGTVGDLGRWSWEDVR